MRLLTNENVPFASVLRLRELGHDVFAVSEALPGAKDPEVLRQAREENRILITFDRDYGELIYRRGLPAPAGVLHLRFSPIHPLQVAEVLVEMSALPHLVLKGRYSVFDGQRVRQRPLP